MGQKHPLEEVMAAHYSTLAWRIPWTEEQPGGLQSMGLQRVVHNWATNLCNNRFKIRKGVCQGCILSPCLFKLYAEYNHAKCQVGMIHKLESRFLGEKTTISEMQMIPNSRKWRGTKEPFDEGERGEWKNWLKTQHSKNEDHGIKSHHFMANRREWSRKRDTFYFLGLQNHCGW